MTFKEINNSNSSYEEYEKACYERAKSEMDTDYAIECLNYSKTINGIKANYEAGTSVDSAVYWICY